MLIDVYFRIDRVFGSPTTQSTSDGTNRVDASGVKNSPLRDMLTSSDRYLSRMPDSATVLCISGDCSLSWMELSRISDGFICVVA